MKKIKKLRTEWYLDRMFGPGDKMVEIDEDDRIWVCSRFYDKKDIPQLQEALNDLLKELSEPPQ